MAITDTLHQLRGASTHGSEGAGLGRLIRRARKAFRYAFLAVLILRPRWIPGRSRSSALPMLAGAFGFNVLTAGVLAVIAALTGLLVRRFRNRTAE